MESLSQIRGLRAVPSQANYIMAEVTGKITAKELTRIMLIRYNLFIKDLTEKTGFAGHQYIRLAVRNQEDNQKLVTALGEIFSGLDGME